jgi:hypothetical protein
MADVPTTEQPASVISSTASDHHEEGFHTIAGFRVGEKNVPFSVIVTFLIIAFIAMIAWIPTQGF